MMLGFAIILTIMLAAVVYFDATKFIIPNRLNLAFILLYPVFIILTPEHIEWWWSLVVILGFFAVGYILFLTNIMGGGDVKLFVALSLWIGWQPQALAAFGLWTALSGGILAVFLLLIRVVLKHKDKKHIPKALQWNEKMPYGLAIAYAFGWLVWTGQVAGLPINFPH